MHESTGNGLGKQTIVGFVGLGVMGSAFSHLLVRRGFRVIGYDVDQDRVRALCDAGGMAADSPAGVRDAADIVVTSLSSGKAFEAVIAGPGGLSAPQGRARLVIETSTLALDQKMWARELLAGVGVSMLDCPVSGTGDHAAAGHGIVFASGDSADIEQAADVLAGLGRAYHYVGAFGAGTRVKLASNLLVATHTVAAAEALLLLDGTQIDPDTALAAIRDSTGNSRMLEVRGKRMLERSYHGPTRLEVLVKDLDLIASLQDELGIDAALFAKASELLRQAADEGYREVDPAAVFEVVSKRRAQNSGGESGPSG